MKLGKRPPKFDSRTPHFIAYLKKGLQPPPAQCVKYIRPVTRWPMMGNDQYGDCTCAAAGHMIEEWTANTQLKPVLLDDNQILQAYRHFSPAGTDHGANMLDVLNYWRKSGIGHDRVKAFAALSPKAEVEVKDAVYLFGNCYIGVMLPDFAVNAPNRLEVPWVVPAKGPVGDAAPNPINGHCIPAVAYDERNLYVVTWGTLKSMTWQFYLTYMDEAYVVLSQDWINKRLKKAPPGLDLKTLANDLSNITNEKLTLTATAEAAA